MRTGKGKVESRSPVAGFSLIEVTISIAITAVALVALMGMLPAGMKTMREATDRAVETRIHQTGPRRDPVGGVGQPLQIRLPHWQCRPFLR